MRNAASRASRLLFYLFPSAELNPDPNDLPPIDPKDAFMLGDAATLSLTNGHSAGTPSAPQVS